MGKRETIAFATILPETCRIAVFAGGTGACVGRTPGAYAKG